MTAALTAWLALVAFIGAATFIPGWPRVAAFVAGAVLSAYVVMAPLGKPDFRYPPPGDYTVLGSRIDKDVAIYVLLNPAGGEPVYYVLPYSEGAAQDLQSALDGREGQGGNVILEMGEGGDVDFGLPPVVGDADKVPEMPMVIGG